MRPAAFFSLSPSWRICLVWQSQNNEVLLSVCYMHGNYLTQCQLSQLDWKEKKWPLRLHSASSLLLSVATIREELYPPPLPIHTSMSGETCCHTLAPMPPPFIPNPLRRTGFLHLTPNDAILNMNSVPIITLKPSEMCDVGIPGDFGRRRGVQNCCLGEKSQNSRPGPRGIFSFSFSYLILLTGWGK